MSDFPEIEPFGPRPPARHDSMEEREELSLPPSPNPNYALTVVTAFGVGIAVGFLLFRYQENILRQTKLDEFLDTANKWIRTQSPKLSEPIRHGIESTGDSFNQAVRSTGSNFDDIVKKVRKGLRF